jgi:hypothetical protein
MTSVGVRKGDLAFREVARRSEGAGVAWAVFAGRVAALFPNAILVCQEDGAVRGIRLPDVDLIAGLTMFEGDAAYTVDLDDEMAARRTFHEIGTVVAPVIPPEDNMLLKAVWGRGLEEGKHDWEDVEAMLAHLPAIDWEYLSWRAAQCGPTPGVRRALEHLQALAQRTGKQEEE